MIHDQPDEVANDDVDVALKCDRQVRRLPALTHSQHTPCTDPHSMMMVMHSDFKSFQFAEEIECISSGNFTLQHNTKNFDAFVLRQWCTVTYEGEEGGIEVWGGGGCGH